MKITKEMVHLAYGIAKKVYIGVLTRNSGKEQIAQVSGMNPGSASDYITVFLDMLAGKEYHRTINSYATKYYLQNIKEDFGQDAFLKAIDATDKHTQYYGSLGRGKLTAIEKIVRDFRKHDRF